MRKTSLYKFHKLRKAKFINFNGWSMPIYYIGSNKEHLNIRNNVGIFDVSHMGEIKIKGKNCAYFLNILLTLDFNTIKIKQANYCLMLNYNGGIIDDLIVYKEDDTTALLCVNSANIFKDFKWIMLQKKINRIKNLSIINESDIWSQIAIQGPQSQNTINKLYNSQILINNFFFINKQLSPYNIDSIIARTGYTGEYGFEIFIKNKHINFFLYQLKKIMSFNHILLCGLSARDSLRIEAGFFLHGNDITEKINPIDANLEWATKLSKKETFIGQNLLFLIKRSKKNFSKVIGIKIKEKAIARKHDKLILNNKIIGFITSGIHSPYLKYSIALAHCIKKIIPNSFSQSFFIKIRTRLIRCYLSLPSFL